MKIHVPEYDLRKLIFSLVALTTLLLIWFGSTLAADKVQEERKETPRFEVSGRDPIACRDSAWMLFEPNRKLLDDGASKKVIDSLEVAIEKGVPWSPALCMELDGLRSVGFSPSQVQLLQSVAQKMVIVEKKPLREKVAAAKAAFEQGNRHYEAGKLDQAIESYRAALRNSPAYWDAWNNMALAEMHRSNDLAALFLLSALTKSNPKYVGASVNLSVCLERLGQGGAAYDLAAVLATKEPKLPMAQYNMGWFENSRGNYASARSNLSNALATVPDYTVAMWLQAINSMESGHSAAADEFKMLPTGQQTPGMPKIIIRTVCVPMADAYSGNTVSARIPKGSQLVISEENGDWCAVYWPVENVKRRLWVHKTSLGNRIESSAIDLKPFLGKWTGEWADVPISEMQIKERNGKPVVTMDDDMEIKDEKLDNGKLTYKRKVRSSGWKFVDTLTATSEGLEMDIFRLRDSKRFLGKLTRK